MNYTIDTLTSAQVKTILYYCPVTIEDCLVHGVQSIRDGYACISSQDLEKAWINSTYAFNRIQTAINNCEDAISRKPKSVKVKKQLKEAQALMDLNDDLQSTIKVLKCA